MNITIIGGGNMGEALVRGLHKTRKVCVCEADGKRARALKNKYGVAVMDLRAALKNASVIVFAVKPQDMAGLLVNVKEALRYCEGSKQLFISIAAGLTTRFFEKGLGGKKVKVVRAMPNMPALIGEGVTALCAGTYAVTKDLVTARDILSGVGKTMVVGEQWMDAVTAVSGSGPAYVFLFVEQWINAARALGFKEAQAKALVYATLSGSARLLEKSAFEADELRARVTSKGGTTKAALDVFSQARFDQTMKKALLAAKKRAQELAK